MEQNCPPKEWLIYIESKLACVDNEQYRGNAVALIKRIRKIQVENGGKLSLLAVNRWIAALEDGFDGLTKSLTPVQQNNPSAQSPIRKKSLQSSRKFGAPKLRRSRDVIDSSTDDIEGTVPARSKRPTRSRRSPPSKEVSVQEAYIDLTRSVKVPLLPQSLSHVNLEKFLENEPTDTVLASSIPADGLEQRIEKETKLGKINIEESVPSSTNTFLMSFSALSKNKRKKKKYRVRQEDDTDDSCPTPIDHLSASGAVVASPCSPSGTNNSLVVPQNYELPYHPIDHKKKLEQIYRSSSPTLEQKLDMMASLIEDGDESYFHVEPVDSSIGVADRIETVGVNNVECTNQVGRLTPGNISRELSADVTHSEHIYHWLRRQNNENFISREIQEDEEGENNSLKECIQRAEKILQEDIPNCSNNHVQHQHFNGQSPEDLIRGNNDVISKSGDSGITELTTRDTILSNSHHRYASKESGLESDITGYTMTSSEHNTRPRQVPPLWLNKSYTRAFRTPQHSRASRHQQSMPLAETVTAVTP
ncbi:uncharacterized protein [Watersipora subatra]|uniref:uncharacterized protein n=1 Tax=Watersipora subatra TaxID=2589382 RepID=UPI00355C66F9